MSVHYRIVIPARLASERLPGKPLIPIAGRPLLEHVFLRAGESAASSVVIATDSAEIQAACRAFGAEAVLTSSSHQSGSDRIAQCIDALGWPDDALVVNLQGDEPLMPPECLDQAADVLHTAPEAAAASLYWPIESADEVDDSNVVKVVTDRAGRALYFSRAPIPHPRGCSVSDVLSHGFAWKRHIGLYAYRAGALKSFSAMGPSPLEQLEKLEQLRFLEAGLVIRMERARRFIPAGVDTPDDLRRVEKILSGAKD